MNDPIRIPMDFKVSTNQIYAGMHWTKRKRIADFYHKIARVEAIRSNIKMFDFPVKISLHFYFKSRPLDVDNCTFMGKCCVDGLKDIIIQDDSYKYLKEITYATFTNCPVNYIEIYFEKY